MIVVMPIPALSRCPSGSVRSLLAVINACLFASFLSALATPASRAADNGPRTSLTRDAEIKTLLRNSATPPPSGRRPDGGLLRIQVVRDGAINAFVTSDNRMYV